MLEVLADIYLRNYSLSRMMQTDLKISGRMIVRFFLELERLHGF